MKVSVFVPFIIYLLFFFMFSCSIEMNQLEKNIIGDKNSSFHASASEWTAGNSYSIGDTVTYNGKYWICKYAHTSNAAWYPGAPGLWFWEETASPTQNPTSTSTATATKTATTTAVKTPTAVQTQSVTATYTTTATKTPVSTPTAITTSVNVAKNKTVTVSSSEGAGYEGSKAVDGNATTRWASVEGIDPQWIIVDLGSNYSINKVVLKWEAAYAKAYTVAVSTDNTNWSDKFTTSTENGGTDTINLSTDCRYVRLTGTVRGTEWGYSLYEMEIYSGSTVTPTATAIVTATATRTATATKTATATFTPTPIKTFTPTATPVAEIITASSENQPNEGKDKAFDKSTATKWLAFQNSAWIRYYYSTAIAVKGYSLTSANDADERDPRNWTLKASHDDINWVTLDTRSNEVFVKRFQKNSYAVNNSTAYKFYRLEFQCKSGTMLQLSEIEYSTSAPVLAVPPSTWQEHWFEHNQIVKLVYYNDDVAIYYDDDMNRTNTTWINNFVTNVWKYTKKTYGNYGTDPRLYVVMHSQRYGGGHPSTYYDDSHDYRNVIDCGGSSFDSQSGWNTAILTHEIGHIVEGASNGTKGSPAWDLWGDSKWCEIFIYDVYSNLGYTDLAQAALTDMSKQTHDKPKAGTYWFRDWYYPVWRDGGKQVMLDKYFKLLAQYFPRNNNDYTRGLNWGEYVHFMSGAANRDLRSYATTTFGWPADFENQFQQAKKDFPGIVY